MMNWIYFQLAMYYLCKAHKQPVELHSRWFEYIEKSQYWIRKIKA